LTKSGQLVTGSQRWESTRGVKLALRSRGSEANPEGDARRLAALAAKNDEWFARAITIMAAGDATGRNRTGLLLLTCHQRRSLDDGADNLAGND
jgi:hypothetical protein